MASEKKYAEKPSLLVVGVVVCGETIPTCGGSSGVEIEISWSLFLLGELFVIIGSTQIG